MRKPLFGFVLPLVLAAALPFVVRAEKANVFFVHGANVSLQGERAWASEMFKRLWQAGAQMNFRPVSWESDIGAPWNYHPNASRLETDFHLAQGIPALSPPTGRTRFRSEIMQSFDMNAPEFKANTWPRPADGKSGARFLHSDIKDVAYFFVHPVFKKIVEVGGLNQ